MKQINLIVLILLLAGCAGTNTMIKPTADQTLAPPAPGRAQIVFLRPSTYFPSMATLLYDVSGERETLIAPIGGMNKVVYDVAPGERLFMSNAGVAHYMSARVEPGKRYFVLVRPIHGYGFQLRPLRKSGTDYNTSIAEFPAWLSNTSKVEASESARATIGQYQAGFDKAKEKGWTEWKAKSAEQRAELTLNTEDGVNP